MIKSYRLVIEFEGICADATDYSKTNKADYDDLEKAICGAGSKASVCGQAVEPLVSECIV